MTARYGILSWNYVANFESEIGTHCEFHCVINRNSRHCQVVLKIRIFINKRKNKVAAAFDLKILSFTEQVGYFSQKCHISGIFLLPPVNFRPTHAII